MKLKYMTMVLALAAGMAWADGDHSQNLIKTTPLTSAVYMLEGQGGNIAVVQGDKSLYVVDTQFEKLYP